jgi:hypothetical protein
MVEALPPGAFHSAVTGNEISMPCGVCKARFCCLCKVFTRADHQALICQGTLTSTILLLQCKRSSAFSSSARWLCSG